MIDRGDGDGVLGGGGVDWMMLLYTLCVVWMISLR